MTTARHQPLSRRGDPAFDEPVEGLPGYMVESAIRWIEPHLTYRGDLQSGVLRDLETALRMDPPLTWAPFRASSAWDSLKERLAIDGELGLDVLDYLVAERSADRQRADLDTLLVRAGSAWRVAQVPGGGHHLERRAPGPVAEAIDALRLPAGERAHLHLRAAWAALMGRDPNPSNAYREAIKAVEVVAKPVLTPDDSMATLGKMTAALRDDSSKWEFDLEHSDATRVRGMCEALWRGQTDRHGDPDPAVPPHVSQEQAQVGFHLALALVQIFASGAIRRA